MRRGPGSVKNVLFVDDHEGLLKRFQQYVERTGRRVHIATSTAQAVEIARFELLDLAIVDYCIPNENGLDICEALLEEAPKLRCVIYSGLESAKLRAEAEKRGITWFDKIPPLQLIEIVEGSVPKPATLTASADDKNRHHYAELLHQYGDSPEEAERVTGIARTTFERNTLPTWARK